MFALFLSEHIGWMRWSAIAVGFISAIIVIQPSFELFSLTSLLPIACAFLFTLYLFPNRAIEDGDSSLVMQKPWQWLHLQLFICIFSSSKCLASRLSRFWPRSNTSRSFPANILGYVLFSDFHTPSKWLGIAIIVASGLFIIWWERLSHPTHQDGRGRGSLKNCGRCPSS